MNRALRKLDRSEFRNKFDECEIRVRLPKDSRFKAPGAGSDGERGGDYGCKWMDGVESSRVCDAPFPPTSL